MKNQWSTTVARHLCDNWYWVYGTPHATLSDRGTNLIGKLMNHLHSFYGIKRHLTSAFHPQCDGMIERLFRTTKNKLRVVNQSVHRRSPNKLAVYGNQWDRQIGLIQFICNGNRNRMNKFSALEITQGHSSNLCFDHRFLAHLKKIKKPPSVPEYVRWTQQQRHLIEAEVAVQHKKYERSMIAQYNRGRSQRELSVGDKVLKFIGHRLKGNRAKLLSQWSGPYVVTQKISGILYGIRRVSHPGRKEERKHIQDLLLFVDRNLKMIQHVRVSMLKPQERGDRFFDDDDLSDRHRYLDADERLNETNDENHENDENDADYWSALAPPQFITHTYS